MVPPDSLQTQLSPAAGGALRDVSRAVSQQFSPSGDVKHDITHAAYLVFSGLLGISTTLALIYGRKTLNAISSRVGTRVSRVAGGVADKLTDQLEHQLKINEYSEEGRSRIMTSMVNDWIHQGKDDATIAGGLRALRLLDEPVNSRRVLENNFNPRVIAKEAGAVKRPVYRQMLEFYDTAIALLQEPDIISADRERMLAAVALHLPAAGGEIPVEQSAVIETLRAMDVKIAPGVRLLAGGDPSKLDALKAAPGIALLLQTDEPLHVFYHVIQPVYLSRPRINERPMVRETGLPDGRRRVKAEIAIPCADEAAAKLEGIERPAIAPPSTGE